MEATRHILIPEHIKLSAKEKEELFKKHNISFIALPKIKPTDAALVGLDCKQGDVIKIVRKSPTAGTAVFYRGVINE